MAISRGGPIRAGLYDSTDKVMQSPEFKELLRLRNLLIKHDILMGCRSS